MLAPIVPAKRIAPVPAVRSRLAGEPLELRVLEKVIFPSPLPVDSTLAAEIETPFVNKMLVALVKRVPEKKTGPPPLCVKAPSMDVPAPNVRVRDPLLERVKGPVPVVVTVPLIISAVPDKLIPEAPVVVRLPVIEMEPDPF